MKNFSVSKTDSEIAPNPGILNTTPSKNSSPKDIGAKKVNESRKQHSQLGERKPNKKAAQHSAAEALINFLQGKYLLVRTSDKDKDVRII
jgi:hypothetical protein